MTKKKSEKQFVEKWVRSRSCPPQTDEFKSRVERLQEKFKKREVKIFRPESEFPELIVVVPDS